MLLAYTLDFEQRSELSLPLSDNVVRLLDEEGVAVQDLPLAAGVSKEAVSMALTSLRKGGYVAVEQKVARLTPAGRKAREGSVRVHEEVEHSWEERFGADAVGGSSLSGAPRGATARRGAASVPGGLAWDEAVRRADERRPRRSRRALPRYPMVLHRGGWPDGS